MLISLFVLTLCFATILADFEESIPMEAKLDHCVARDGTHVQQGAKYIETQFKRGLAERATRRCIQREKGNWELRLSHCLSPKGQAIPIDGSVTEEYPGEPWKGETFEFRCRRKEDGRVWYTWEPDKDFFIVA
ncbi:hypothetical protein AB6A40_005764 [Gnathostoma spinigerum]|uniref:Uncharacterized protein n=1 Tax=Gnathostoma spinigerum TaxID=75299 RepID=A0ABD6EGD5_9BILA